MPDPEIDLLAIAKGLVTAPAGCGKTHLIASALTRHTGAKPILVLTHTNSGVAALRGRLERAGAPSKAYRLQTIDGFAMRLARTFPLRTSLADGVMDLRNPAADYPAIRTAVATMLAEGAIDEIIGATYVRVIVDEYQDCNVRQHAIVTQIARTLPAAVLGDPMQAIFDFGRDPVVPWETVGNEFPLVGELATPWRWKNAKTEELGKWLLEVRKRLLNGDPINLKNAPAAVKWIKLNGTNDAAIRIAAAKTEAPTDDGKVLIIADSRSPDSQRRIASQTPGAVTVEAVDLKDLVSFAATFTVDGKDCVTKLLAFAQSVMTNVGAANLIERVKSLIKGTAKNPPSDVEGAALAYVRDRSFAKAVDLLVEISAEAGVREHRPAVLRACIRAMQLCATDDTMTFRDAAILVREEHRLTGRPLAKRSVGSTLLLKGLEAEAVVVLNADNLDARNLYVALTRGSMAVTICSSQATITKAKPT